MNRHAFVFVCGVGVLLVAASACSDGGRRRGGSGPVVMVDGGGGTDLGGGGMGTGPMVDLGGRDMGSACVNEPIDYVAGPYCGAATQSCIDGCTTGTCVGDCLDADPSGDCSACANINVIACANANGCLAQWNAFDCCFQANCATSMDMNCGTSFCSTQRTAFGDCANRVLPTATCSNDYTSCF